MLNRIAPCLVASCLLAPAWAQGPILSEFVARNQSTLLDEDFESSDWIELYNLPGAGAADLSGWSLTDDPTDLAKWTFQPGTMLGNGVFLIVFASDKDRRDPAGTLHTNFKLSGGGEYLALVDPLGTIVTEYAPQYPPQFEDVSYGLQFNPLPGTDERFFSNPSPNGPNFGGGPPAWGAAHTPVQPTDTEELVVTAIAPSLGGVAPNVDLVYQVMYNSEVTLAMRDDGVAPDPVAGDEVFTGAVPASASLPGEMVRYKVLVSDALGATTLPPFPSPLNSPEWQGTVIADPTLSSQLPIWEWFVQNPSGATSSSGTRCSMWLEGQFYDNVLVKRRGGSSNGYPRKSFKFDFNPEFRPTLSAIGTEIDEINLNTHWADKAHVRQVISYNLYQDVGCEGSTSFPVRLQQNGAFYSVQTYVEEPDRFLLERAGLDENGALYKMYNTLNSSTSGVEKVTRTFEGNADLAALVSALQTGGPGMEDYLFDNIDIPQVLSYLVATWLMHDNDHVHKNYYLYRDSDGTGEWRFIPWDKDLTWGRNYTLSGGVLNDTIWYDRFPQSHIYFGDQQHPKIDGFWNRLINRVYQNPRLREMYLRRLRTVCDQMLNPPGTPANQRYFENTINDWYSLMSPDVVLDEALWGLPTYGTSRDFLAAKDRLISEYVENRRDYLFLTQTVSSGGSVPASEPRHNRLVFTSWDIAPASGVQDEEYLQLTNFSPWAVDLSEYTLFGGVTMEIPKGTVVEAGGSVYLSPHAGAFRARSVAPSGGQGLFVVDSYSGHFAPGEVVMLIDRTNVVRARAAF